MSSITLLLYIETFMVITSSLVYELTPNQASSIYAEAYNLTNSNEFKIINNKWVLNASQNSGWLMGVTISNNYPLIKANQLSTAIITIEGSSISSPDIIISFSLYFDYNLYWKIGSSTTYNVPYWSVGIPMSNNNDNVIFPECGTSTNRINPSSGNMYWNMATRSESRWETVGENNWYSAQPMIQNNKWNLKFSLIHQYPNSEGKSGDVRFDIGNTASSPSFNIKSCFFKQVSVNAFMDIYITTKQNAAPITISKINIDYQTTIQPTNSPIPPPTNNPTSSPTKDPTPSPTAPPPTSSPTPSPTDNPTPATFSPTFATKTPTATTNIPTKYPTKDPTKSMTTTTATTRTTINNSRSSSFSSTKSIYSDRDGEAEIKETIQNNEEAAMTGDAANTYFVFIYVAIGIVICCCIPFCIFAILKWRQRDERLDRDELANMMRIGSKTGSDNLNDGELSPSATSGFHRYELKHNPSLTIIETHKMKTIIKYNDGSNDGIEIGKYNNMDTEGKNIKNWLIYKVELDEYLSVFIENGYKDLNGIQQIKDIEELENIGIDNKQHQNTIMREINILRTTITPWSPIRQHNKNGTMNSNDIINSNDNHFINHSEDVNDNDIDVKRGHKETAGNDDNDINIELDEFIIDGEEEEDVINGGYVTKGGGDDIDEDQDIIDVDASPKLQSNDTEQLEEIYSEIIKESDDEDDGDIDGHMNVTGGNDEKKLDVKKKKIKPHHAVQITNLEDEGHGNNGSVFNVNTLKMNNSPKIWMNMRTDQ